MRIRRILAAVIATAALAGLGLTGAATAQGAPSYVTPSQCTQGGGTADLTDNTCKGGMYDGEKID
ncbi:hypothetical protein [Streptomyces diastatochromogenes]|uniref:Uncharacterized protein n=1 Tax=Streptomyces diastatochromogenes TaxID=42236 RepID=A0A233SDJ5_STRDA|nr:hypothetical protein [Streptomyces diastatochromogenes]MCZ0987809.1 hypothetical protein [Streptomyces diastatochromogenes]OXY93733.1 hypothetical protein BEK98_21940 [Streptomyces diastatochromogenes]